MANADLKPVIFLAFANDRDDRVRYLRNLPDEARRIRDILAQAKQAGLCDVVERSNASLQDILNVFQHPDYRNRIAIFHFGGHANGYQLLLESSTGKATVAYAEGLAAFLGHQTGLQLVFLNGCSTQQQAQGLLDHGVSTVIATARSINDQTAMDFAARFYQGLAGGAAIRTAYAEAVAAVQAATGGNTRDLHWEKEIETDRWPWDLYLRNGAEVVTQWNLPETVQNPLFGLPPLPPLDLPDSPFRHLHWFEREHAAVFFGRGYQIRDLYQQIITPTAPPHNAPPIILFYGQSGVGKSSVLAAGLLPRLEGTHTIRYIRRDPEKGLAGHLRDILLTDNTAPVNADAWRELETRQQQPVLIMLDQVEEIFTRPRGNPEQELHEFCELLVLLLSDPGRRPQGKLILGFRKEWLAEIEQRLIDHKLPRTPIFLERLDRRGIIEAIAGPAQSERLQPYHLVIEKPKPGEAWLPDIIADDLLADAESAIAPTLQILLTKMWEQAKAANDDQPVFDLKLYNTLRKDGILLGDFLDQQLKAIQAWRPAVVESGLTLDVLAFHTTPLGTAAQHPLPELQQEYAHQAGVLPELLEKCQGLVATVKPRKDAPTASRLAHDTLAPLVRERFEKSDKPGQRARRILENRAVEWRENKEGTPLDETDLELVEKGVPGMRTWTADEQRLIAVSRDNRAKRQRNRRILQGIGLITVIIILITAGVALWQWDIANERRIEAVQQSRIALIRSLVAYALQDNLQDERERAALLARHASLLNQQYHGNVEAQIDDALHTIFHTSAIVEGPGRDAVGTALSDLVCQRVTTKIALLEEEWTQFVGTALPYESACPEIDAAVPLRLRRERMITKDFRALSLNLSVKDTYLRPIRNVKNQFEDRGSVIFDRATGLTWQRSGSSEVLSYQDAQMYVNTLNIQQFAGYTDWRLPTIEELLSLLKKENTAGSFFKLTTDALDLLQIGADPVPDDVLARLQPLVDQKIVAKADFVSAVQQRIGADAAAQYQANILEAAAHRLYIHPMVDNDQVVVWSSDVYRGERSAEDVWYVDFYYGSLNVSLDSPYNFVRAVRS